MMFSVIFIMLTILLWYVFKGYLLVLHLLQWANRTTEVEKSVSGISSAPFVTVLVTVHNEASGILSRISNLLSQEYPPGFLEILVASDCSTDGTDEAVQSVGHPSVRLFRSPRRLGKTATQNMAILEARGEIMIFTDVDTAFDRFFVENIVAAFKDPAIGAADGHLILAAQDGNQVAQTQGYYWRYELQLREAESQLGILAVSSGATLAVRKSLFREMDPSIGEDCIVPLDVVAQGYRVVHVRDALAYDRMESAPEREFRARVRMTLRNWQGTWSRPELLNPLRNPGIAWALWSHKILRWLTPFFVLGLVLTANLWATQDLASGWFAAALVDSLVLLALIGWWGDRVGIRVPFAGAVFSFMLANAGFLVGVLRAVAGHSIREYRKA